MVLAMPIVHPTCPEVVLLRAGASLDEKCIERLRGIGIREAWIRYPSLDHLTAFVSPQVHDACRSLTGTVGRALDTVLADSHARLDFYSYKKAVLGLLEKLIAKPSAAIFVSELVAGDKPMLRHASNVCVLSILMGLKLDFYLLRERARVSSAIARDLSGLGVGAMLHDVGLMRLSDETLERFRATRDESDPAWREHVTLGFDMVKGDLDPTAAAAVLHHHQRYDGSGFPRRIDLHGVSLPVSGSEIHVFARIVACADLFDRLRHPAHVPGDDETLLPSVPASPHEFDLHRVSTTMSNRAEELTRKAKRGAAAA
jgi:HD-GYP domain-containing protein (c-di-GMP phosphodiesterase class II)